MARPDHTLYGMGDFLSRKRKIGASKGKKSKQICRHPRFRRGLGVKTQTTMNGQGFYWIVGRERRLASIMRRVVAETWKMTVATVQTPFLSSAVTKYINKYHSNRYFHTWILIGFRYLLDFTFAFILNGAFCDKWRGYINIRVYNVYLLLRFL